MEVNETMHLETKKIDRFRVLHSASLLRPSTGMLSQMDIEAMAVKSSGIPWTCAFYTTRSTSNESGFQSIVYDEKIERSASNGPILSLVTWVRLRYRYHRWLLSQASEYDAFLLRYYIHDPFQAMFVLRSKKPIIFLHHTYIKSELALDRSVTGKIRYFSEYLLGKLSKNFATANIGVTPELTRLAGEETSPGKTLPICHPNGIYVDHSNNTLEKDLRTEQPEILFVANFMPWHGLAELLQEAGLSSEDFLLHVVGKVPSQLIDPQSTDYRIKFHGELSSSEIALLARSCWLGLSTLALFQYKEMRQSCSLKTRQYLSMGIPSYGDADIFEENFRFYKEGGVDMASILGYAKNVRQFSRSEVFNEAKPLIDKQSIVLNTYQCFKEAFSYQEV